LIHSDILDSICIASICSEHDFR